MCLSVSVPDGRCRGNRRRASACPSFSGGFQIIGESLQTERKKLLGRTFSSLEKKKREKQFVHELVAFPWEKEEKGSFAVPPTYSA